MSTSPPPPRRNSVEAGLERAKGVGTSSKASSPPVSTSTTSASAATGVTEAGIVAPIACSSPVTAASASLLAVNAPSVSSAPTTSTAEPAPALATAVNEANAAAVARASEAISEVGAMGTNSTPSVSASEPSVTSKTTAATSVDDGHSRKDSEPGVIKAPPGTLLTDAVSRVIEEGSGVDTSISDDNVRVPEVSNEPTAQPYTANKTPFPMPAGVRILVNAGAQLPDSTLPRAVAEKEESTGITLGKLRCYWALLSRTSDKASDRAPEPTTVLHLDPVLAAHLDDDSPKMIGSSIADFVHPEDRLKTVEEISSVQHSETLFGSATRCRFASLAKIRSILTEGSPSRSNSTDEAQLPVQPPIKRTDDYLPVDIVVNCVGDGLYLAFFHAVLDESPDDDDEKNTTQYSNWCGTPSGAFSKRECDKIWQQLKASQDLHADQTGPSRVFQVLSNSDKPEILLSWPPPRLFPPDTAPHVLASSHLTPFMDGSYFADDFARLARGIDLGASSGASTSCTRRFRAKHTMTTEGLLRSIESVLIPYGSITLACYHVEFSQSLSRDDLAAPPSVVPPFDRVPSPGPAESRPTLGGPTGRARKSSWAAPGDEVVKRARTKRTRSDQGATRRTSTSSDDHPPAPSTTTLPPAPMPFRTPAGSARFGGTTMPLASLYSSDAARSYGRGSSNTTSPVVSRAYGSNRDRSTSGSRTTLPEFSSLDSLASLASASASIPLPSKPSNLPPRSDPLSSHRPPAPRPSGLPSMAAMGLEGIPDSPSGRNVGTLAAVAAAAAAQTRRCLSCGTTNSPEWRKGPAGPKTLCNSCGIRESRKRRKAEQEAHSARGGNGHV